MFDTSYKFKYRNKETVNEGGLTTTTHNFTFSDYKNRPFIVRVEQLPYSLYVLEFYPKEFKDSPNKYSKLTNWGRVPALLNTCVNIFTEYFLDKEKTASLAFIGSEIEGEGLTNTKRFRVY